MIEVSKHEATKASPARPEYEGDITFRSYGKRMWSPGPGKNYLQFRQGRCEFSSDNIEEQLFGAAFAPCAGEEPDSPCIQGGIWHIKEAINWRGEGVISQDELVLVISGRGGATGSKGENLLPDHVLHLESVEDREDAEQKFEQWVRTNHGDQITKVMT